MCFICGERKESASKLPITLLAGAWTYLRLPLISTGVPGGK